MFQGGSLLQDQDAKFYLTFEILFRFDNFFKGKAIVTVEISPSIYILLTFNWKFIFHAGT